MKPAINTNKLTRAFHKTTFKFKKHSPEILVVTGIVGAVASTVLACKATRKADKLIDNAKNDVARFNELVETNDNYTEEDLKEDVKITYVQTGLQVAKVYAPAAIVGVLSIASILTSHKIIRGRNMALTAAFGALAQEFKDYRGNVVERFGKEVDQALKFGIKEKEVEKTVVDENGNKKTVKEVIKVSDPKVSHYSEYARYFDESNPFWHPYAEDSLTFLKQQERLANEKLQRQGYLLLNDVYEGLGFPKTKAGMVVGWRYDPNGIDCVDNYVSFGLDKPGCMAYRTNYDCDTIGEQVVDFVNGYIQTVLLDFNVDGNIYELM